MPTACASCKYQFHLRSMRLSTEHGCKRSRNTEVRLSERMIFLKSSFRFGLIQKPTFDVTLQPAFGLDDEAFHSV